MSSLYAIFTANTIATPQTVFTFSAISHNLDSAIAFCNHSLLPDCETIINFIPPNHPRIDFDQIIQTVKYKTHLQLSPLSLPLHNSLLNSKLSSIYYDSDDDSFNYDSDDDHFIINKNFILICNRSQCPKYAFNGWCIELIHSIDTPTFTSL